ncbi:MAG: polymer-forming cytoskeletal protein [Alphaproteobacteria bacterium]
MTEKKPTSVESLIGTDMKIDGNITVEGHVRLDGTLVGDLKGKTIVIGPKGELRGTVSADELTVEGAVFGSIDARSVTLKRSARVFGDVQHEVIEVDAGAEIEGQYSRTSYEAKSTGKVKLGQATEGLGRMQKEPPPTAPGRAALGAADRASKDIVADTDNSASSPETRSTH